MFRFEFEPVPFYTPVAVVVRVAVTLRRLLADRSRALPSRPHWPRSLLLADRVHDPDEVVGDQAEESAELLVRRMSLPSMITSFSAAMVSWPLQSSDAVCTIAFPQPDVAG